MWSHLSFPGDTLELSPGPGELLSADGAATLAKRFFRHFEALRYFAYDTMFRQGGKSTSVVADGRRKVHTTFEDEGELVEEYDMRTDELLCAPKSSLRRDALAAMSRLSPLRTFKDTCSRQDEP